MQQKAARAASGRGERRQRPLDLSTSLSPTSTSPSLYLPISLPHYRFLKRDRTDPAALTTARTRQTCSLYLSISLPSSTNRSTNTTDLLNPRPLCFGCSSARRTSSCSWRDSQHGGQGGRSFASARAFDLTLAHALAFDAPGRGNECGKGTAVGEQRVVFQGFPAAALDIW